MKKITLFVAALIIAAHAFSITTYTVSSSGTNSGTSYTTIKGAVAAAVAAAASDAEIDIAAGIYTEPKITFSNISLTFKGAGMDQTIIQGQADGGVAVVGSVFLLDGTYTTPCTISIQNLTIKNGSNGTGAGGGAIRYSSTTSTVGPALSLNNVKMINNVANSGGGIYLYGVFGSLDIVGCYIAGNFVSPNYGGGVCVQATGAALGTSPETYGPTPEAARVTIRNSTIANNTASLAGGGVYVYCGTNGGVAAANSLKIENSTIYGNSFTSASSNYGGGGVYFRTCASGQTVAPTNNLTLNHCTIAGNRSFTATVALATNTGKGGDGVCVELSGGYVTALSMNNSIVMANSGSSATPSQVGSNSSNVTQAKISNGGVTNSIFGIISGGSWATAGATNNILTATINQLDFAGTLSSDIVPVLKIGALSIAKDLVATDYITVPLTLDQLGLARNGAADAGAYEYPADVATALAPAVSSQSMIVTKSGLLSKANGTVEIYSFNGQLLKTIKVVEGQFISLSAGSYLVRLISAQGVSVEKIML